MVGYLFLVADRSRDPITSIHPVPEIFVAASLAAKGKLGIGFFYLPFADGAVHWIHVSSGFT